MTKSLGSVSVAVIRFRGHGLPGTGVREGCKSDGDSEAERDGLGE
jgi:hypothetical protein